jgi:hypothetical protein
MTRKKLLLGSGAMLAMSVVLGELISLSGLYELIDPTAQSIATGFFAAAAGASIARKGFLLPAYGVMLAIWAANIYVLYQIAAPTGQASVVSIVQYNVLGFAISLVAVTAGVLVGQWVAGRRAQATGVAT